tara:strand:+ start:537 stop:725 length:189 start_codon:yes stop_codon:yes gene_type:complete
MESKSALWSKTLWVNFLVATGAIVGNWVPALGELMSSDNLLIVFSVVNMVLRAVTKDAIEFK